MTATRPRNRSLKLAFLAVATLLIAATATKAPEFALPLGPDQGVYAYVGQVLLSGGMPYRDVWENKPPGVYLVYASLQGLLPDAWDTCPAWGLPYRCGQILFASFDLMYSIVLSAAVFGAARAFNLNIGAAFIAALFTGVYSNQALLSHGGVTPEKLMLLPATLALCAFLAYLRRKRGGWLMAAGALGGLAFLFKQPGVLVLVAIVVARGFQSRPWRMHKRERFFREVSLLGVGALAPVATAGVYLAAAGALDEFIADAFVFNLFYASADADQLAWNFAAGVWRSFHQASGLLWLLAVAGVLGLLSSGLRLSHGIPLIVWALFDVISLFLGGSKFGDRYFVQLVPSFSLLAGAGVQWLVHAAGEMHERESAMRPISVWLASASVVVLLLSVPFQTGVTMRVWNDRFRNGLALSPDELAAGWVRSSDAESLYVWGYGTDVYVLSGARAPTRFIHHVPLSQALAQDPGFRARRSLLLQDLHANPPELIGIEPSTARLDPDGRRFLLLSSFPELETLLKERYDEERDRQMGGWRLFRLRSPHSASA